MFRAGLTPVRLSCFSFLPRATAWPKWGWNNFGTSTKASSRGAQGVSSSSSRNATARIAHKRRGTVAGSRVESRAKKKIWTNRRTTKRKKTTDRASASPSRTPCCGGQREVDRCLAPNLADPSPCPSGFLSGTQGHAGDGMGTTLFKAYPRLSIAATPPFLRLSDYENRRHLLSKTPFMAYTCYFYALLPICKALGVSGKRCAPCGLLCHPRKGHCGLEGLRKRSASCGEQKGPEVQRNYPRSVELPRVFGN